jgi:putative endonuclease
MSSPGGTLYTGVTNDIWRRVLTHKERSAPGFTQKYNVTRLVYFEESNNVHDAIYREKQIKGWTRSKKIMLIESFNPKWNDLSEGWFSKE